MSLFVVFVFVFIFVFVFVFAFAVAFASTSEGPEERLTSMLAHCVFLFVSLSTGNRFCRLMGVGEWLGRFLGVARLYQRADPMCLRWTRHIPRTYQERIEAVSRTYLECIQNVFSTRPGDTKYVSSMFPVVMFLESI